MAGTTRSVRVEGLRELLFVTDRLGKEARKAVRKELRAAAVPMRDEAQRLYNTEIGPDEQSVYHARYGISIRKSGVISVEQRIKSKHPKDSKFKRPKFNELQWTDALGPARDQTAPQLDKVLSETYERLRRQWVFGA